MATKLWNWLIANQNAHGSYVSMYDSIVAFDAITWYYIRNGEPELDLSVTLIHGNDFKKPIQLTRKKDQVMRTLRSNASAEELRVTVTGSGRAMLSVVFGYRSTIQPHERCVFNVSVKPSFADVDTIDLDVAVASLESLAAKNRRTKRSHGLAAIRLEVCVTNLEKEAIAMTLIQVDLPSGFEPFEADLADLRNRGRIGQYGVAPGRVDIYVNGFPAGVERCFEFRILQTILVGNLQSTAVRVFDYYGKRTNCPHFYSVPNREGYVDCSRTVGTADDGVCACILDGCPVQVPFNGSLTDSLRKIEPGRQLAKAILCMKDYSLNATVVQCDGHSFCVLRLTNMIFKKKSVPKDFSSEPGTLLVFAVRPACQTLLQRNVPYFISNDYAKPRPDDPSSAQLVTEDTVIHPMVDGPSQSIVDMFGYMGTRSDC